MTIAVVGHRVVYFVFTCSVCSFVAVSVLYVCLSACVCARPVVCGSLRIYVCVRVRVHNLYIFNMCGWGLLVHYEYVAASSFLSTVTALPWSTVFFCPSHSPTHVSPFVIIIHDRADYVIIPLHKMLSLSASD